MASSPLPPSPRREGGNHYYISDLSPSPLGEGFRERQKKEFANVNRVIS